MKTNDWTSSMKEEDDEVMEDVDVTEEVTESEEMDTMFDAPGLFDEAEEAIKGSDIEELPVGNQGDKGEAPPIKYMAGNKESTATSGQAYHGADGAPISLANGGGYGEEVPPCLAGGNHIPLTNDDMVPGKDDDMAPDADTRTLGNGFQKASEEFGVRPEDRGAADRTMTQEGAVSFLGLSRASDSDSPSASIGGYGGHTKACGIRDEFESKLMVEGCPKATKTVVPMRVKEEAIEMHCGDVVQAKLLSGPGESVGIEVNMEGMLESKDIVFVDNDAEHKSQETDEFSFASMECDEVEGGIAEMVSSPGPFDMKLLRSCIQDGNLALNTVQGKDVVIVVGKTGVGKSLFLQGIAGKQIKPVAHESTCFGKVISTKVFEAVDPLPGFDVGHDKVSKTRSINCLVRQGTGRKGEDVVYVDSPGWDDTGGAEVDIATSVMFSQVAKKARSLRLVVLISYASLLEDRGGAMRAVLKLAHTFVSDFEKDKKSFAFLFTHTNEVDIPSSLDEARSCLADEILRIRKDTVDAEVMEILKFMHASLVKKYGFVDVLHPLTADFVALSSFIETKLATIRNPSPMANCGLTVKSEMKLNAQIQQMLFSLHRLIQPNKILGAPEYIRELKEIKDMFGYFLHYVGIGGIEQAYNECEELFKKHTSEQRVAMEDQLQRAKDGNAHFGAGNVHILMVALSHLKAFAPNEEEELVSRYGERRVLEVFEMSFVRVEESNLENLELTLKELQKLQAWAEGFPCCMDGYEKACRHLQTRVHDISARLSQTCLEEFEAMGEEELAVHAQDLVTLGTIVKAASTFSLHGIHLDTELTIFTNAKNQVATLATKWRSIGAASPHTKANLVDDIWTETPLLLKLMERAKKLEALQTLLHLRLPVIDLIEIIGETLEKLESFAVQQFQSLCRHFQGSMKDLARDLEEKMDLLGSINSELSRLSPQRWQSLRQLYIDTVNGMRSLLLIKGSEMESAARACVNHGLQDGQKDGEKYKSLRSCIWFDDYVGNDFLRSTCDSVYMMYRSRLETIIVDMERRSASLELLSIGNAERLNGCHEAALEIKQFEQFDSLTQTELDVVGRRKIALEGVREYKAKLKNNTDELCSQWLAHLKEYRADDEATSLTMRLDRTLEEIEVIESFSVLLMLRCEANSAKKLILSTFKSASDFAEKEFTMPLEYQTKADILACIAKINGCSRTDNYLPKFSEYKEKARNIVAGEAVQIEELVAKSADGNAIDAALKDFEESRVLDPYTNDEATKRLRPLQSLREKKSEERDELLEDMIARQDYCNVGKFLKPLRISRDIVKRERHDQYARTIAEHMKVQARTAQEKLRLKMSQNEAQYVVDTLRTLKDADKEFGASLKNANVAFQLPSKIDGLEKGLNRKLSSHADAVASGDKANDFFVMGVNQHLAGIIFETAEPFLERSTKRKYHNSKSKWEAANSLIQKKVDTFIDTSFQNCRQLETVLSTLQNASKCEDPELPHMQELYEAAAADLSKKVADQLLRIREHVNDAGCYDDGMAALEAFEKARAQGLEGHIHALPFDCKLVLGEWKEEERKLYMLGTSAGNPADNLRQTKQRMYKLKNPSFLDLFVFNRELTYKKLQQQWQQRVREEFQDGGNSLRQRDFVALQRSLGMLDLIAKELDTHIPSAEMKKREMEDRIVQVFVDTCLKSVQYLEDENLIDFESIFRELRQLAIHFTFVLDKPVAKKEFCLVAHLVHDILAGGVAKLQNAVSSLEFLEIRNLVMSNRTHGAFLADHFGLLYEELQQRGKLGDEEWFGRIWKICRTNYACGRDLLKIKSCAVLGVVPSASESEIRKAFKQKALLVHPDKKLPVTGDAGEEFRRAKAAQDDLLDSSRFGGGARPFDSLILEVPRVLDDSVRDYLRHQKYDLLESLLEQLSNLQMVSLLVDPAIPHDKIVADINNLVRKHMHGIRLQVDSCWTERKYKELNFCIDELKTAEKHLKSFPEVFPESWNQGIIEKVEKEITSQGMEARSFLSNKKHARECIDDFRRCFIQMGAVLVELQMFKDFTKGVMYGVLESCLKSEWGYNYLFDLGLSLHRGDESISDDDNRIGQTLLSEFSHFKEVMTMVWNEETAQKPPEDTVRDIRGTRRDLHGNAAPVQIERDALLMSYHSFESAYKLLLGEYLPSGSDIGKLARQTIDLANSVKPSGCSSGWDAKLLDKIPDILAGIFAMFTIMKSGESYNRIKETSNAESLGDNLLMKPHNIQVLTLLHLLGCGKASGSSLENQLMQIRTGEGKSMILGAASAILGLLGFNVRCVCYSEYLSTRDYSLFEAVFRRLNLGRSVIYSKITTLSEDTTALKGDIRGLTEMLLCQGLEQPHPVKSRPGQASARISSSSNHRASLEAADEPESSLTLTHITRDAAHLGRDTGGSSTPSSSLRSNTVGSPSVTVPNSAETEEILLVDEVDVFFGSGFYGQTYNQVTELRRPEIAVILKDIWEHYTKGGRKQRLADVQATSAYRMLVHAMPSFQFLIDNEVRLMLDHVQRVEDEPYFFDPENDRIGYKVLDTISFQVTYGYRTVFAYLKEASNGNLRNETETLRRELFMPVSCGQFSYANIAPTRILGVSGTLEAMGDFEKNVLLGYGIEKYVFVPSVYGQSNFVFDKAGDGIFIERSKSDYFQKICEEAQAETRKKRAVIVFFKDSARLDEFKSSPFFPKLGRQKTILSEGMEPGDKEFVINKAATPAQVTLCPAVFGRGTDFFCKDDRVQDAGGVHIIQAFLSTETSEEVQIQGRTARQGKKGSYQMVLLESDLRDDFGLANGEHDKIPRERRYEWLHRARNKKHGQHWKSVGENLKLATKRDAATHQYFDALLAGRQHAATSLFKDLYLMIKKPPVPDAISVDISFVFDITGSMTPYCQHILSTVDGLVVGTNSILSKLRPAFPDTSIKIRIGAMAFRDIDDGSDQFNEAVWNGGGHFTESVSDAMAFIKNAASSPSGGQDLAEDILGAASRCAGWNGASDWSSSIKMIVLFTDAPAHGFVPPCSTGQPNVDGYAVRHPRGLTPTSVACDLIAKGINLVVCSYNPLATALTEEKIAEEYLNHPDNSSGREIKRISMVPQSAIVAATSGQPLLGDQPKHMIFVLDESGSMSGQWPGVVKSFREYVARRRQNQNELDLVSVVQFDDTARVTVQLERIGSAPSSLDYRGNGTCFAPAASEASQLAARTPTSHKPTVVFMSDGGTNDAATAAATFSALNNQVLQKHGSDLELHVIAFGNGADTQQLQQIARASPTGRVHLSSDTVQLSNIFVSIAGGQHVATALQGEIAKEISEAVSDTLSLEYLS